MKTIFLAALAAAGIFSASSSAMAGPGDPPYPHISTQDIETCRPQFAALKSQVASYYRAEAAAYAPGGQFYSPSYADGENTRVYNGIADRTDAADAVAWWAEGMEDDGEGFGGLDNIYNSDDVTNATVIAIGYGAKGLGYDGGPRTAANLDHTPGNLYSFADGDAASQCVDQVYMAKYDEVHATGAQGNEAQNNDALGGDATQIAAATGCDASPDAALACFNNDFADFTRQYPQPDESKGARAIYQYSYFLGAQGLQILDRYKASLGPNYDANYNALAGMRDSGHNGCNALSSSSDDCQPVYPQ